MQKVLEEGQTRMIQGGRQRTYKVVAECYDRDTPYIHVYNGKELICTLTDTDAVDLAADIQAALRILPTSK